MANRSRSAIGPGRRRWAPLDILRTVKRNLVVPTIRAAGGPFVLALAWRGPKTFSAMMRVKNESEFLYEAVVSIIDHVEEVVIVDNMSTDKTPEIIARLVEEFPRKIVSREYRYQLARYGEENRNLGSTRAGRRSPKLLANYYNWCLSQCAHPFILKWDGDTIATAELGRQIAAFRTSSKQSLWHIGANLHESRTHLIVGRPYEEPEPRLFYRRFARYNNNLDYCELLVSPYVWPTERYIERAPKPLYVHMKYCKSDRFSNMSADLQAQAIADSQPGEPVDPEIRDTIERWQLAQIPSVIE